MNLPAMLARLRNPKPTDIVAVTLTGHSHAVVQVARALATVTTVTAMHHKVQDGDVIRLDATCHRLLPVRVVDQ